MPFGLHRASATFQRMMDKVLQGAADHAVAFIDDVAVYSETWEDHLQHSADTLDRFREAGLTAKPGKCKLGMCHTTYLGHQVGGGLVKPEMTKVEAVREYPRPENKTQVRAFLGLTGYYRKFIPNFSEVAAPLTDLTRKGSGRLLWNRECESAFKALKEVMCTLPVLWSPNYQKTFILQTDASQRGLGAVLSQLDKDGSDYPVMYISRKLLSREQQYSTIEKECLAIVWAIRSLWYYLYGRQFVIQTDHQPLTWLGRMKDGNSRLTRWILELQPFSYEVQHRAGKANANADSLSRNPIPI